MKKVSVLLLTIDRVNHCREYITPALANAGYPFELCISDNGSVQPEIFEWCEQQNPKVYFKNGYNYGTAQSLNRMIRANPSDYYVFIGNDIRLPENWLKTFVQYAEALEEQAGVIGIDWRGLNYENKELTTNDGFTKIVWDTTNVFGTMFVTQTLRNKIGEFCEEYGTYGLFDSDYSIRATAAGFNNFYLPNIRSHHFGNDVGENTAYRKMKDESLEKAQPIFNKNWEKYKQGEYYKSYTNENNS
jgi:GT2 family glycosyltransferase